MRTGAVFLAVAAAVYVRGWWVLAQRPSPRFGAGRLAAFVGGLAAIAIALASPLDELAEQRLSAHMVQQQLLMMVAPPLLWLGAPVAPMLLGLPRPLRRLLGAALASRFMQPIAHVLARPTVGWLSFALTFWVWHAAPLYELVLRADAWHHVEQACFLASAMLFWWPVVLPWPAQPAWPRWTMIPYLLLSDVQNTILAAILTLSDRLVYPAYAMVAGGQPSALGDQVIAGLITWLPGSLIFLVAAVWLGVEALSEAPAVRDIAPAREGVPADAPGSW